MNVITMKNVNKEFKRYVKKDGFIRNFFKREYEIKKAVSDLSLSIKQGEIVGLLGQNGAGKTTTMKLLSGLIVPTEGTIEVLGYDPFQKKNDFKKQISLLLGQKQQLWWDISASDNFKLFRDIYEINESEYEDNLKELVDMLDAADIISSPIRTLSLGERMKCEIIAALLHKPKILFLDEPTIGLDVVAQKKIREFVKQYSEKNKATILITSHNMADIEETCQRIIFIDKGRKYYDGTLTDFVERYGEECILNIEFISSVDSELLSQYGEIIKNEGNRAKIKVSKNEYDYYRKQLIANNNVLNVLAEELDATEILRNYFLAKEKPYEKER
ncbi:ABC transporter ATP-binding protein [Clostridium disporicum]|uniref:ABC transporter ATPase n=1 Tax=Clostridium disporicum TaxID=84024 RepID=A0A174ESA5_9CLOT|nr:ATP-binding cassette domain-containing protein [Clostridium disporicum]CUO40813.1 ABC transporter ATPase [Clostridium disporicum]